MISEQRSRSATYIRNEPQYANLPQNKLSENKNLANAGIRAQRYEVNIGMQRAQIT